MTKTIRKPTTNQSSKPQRGPSMDYRRAFFGLSLVLILTWCGYVTYRVAQQPTSAPSQADTWLFAPTNVTGDDGQTLSRASLLDSVVASALQNTADAAADVTPPPDDQ